MTREFIANLLESIMPASSDTTSPDSQNLDSVEARMRRALGHAHQAPVSENRAPDRPSGDRPRKRFVQDGDVAVTIVNRQGQRDAGGLAVPEVSRLSIVQKALASERILRERAERALQESLATVHDLKTKLGHAELARQEATAAVEALRADAQEREARLKDELATERPTRVAAEAALQKALAAQELAEEALRAATAPQPEIVPRPAKATRKANPKPREPQPVKWWLSTAKKR